MENRHDPGPVGVQGRHGLQLLDRENMTVTGVTAVESFDDTQIVLETLLGMLTLKGEDLNIKQLDLDTGRFAVEGYVNSVVYSTTRQGRGRPKGARGFLERLLR